MKTKTAMITIAGRPNVGKSTLTNYLVGEKIAIVSNKPQTTRNRICGIVTRGDTQFVFVDTPGYHRPRTKLGDYMVNVAQESIADVDLTILVVEPIASIGPQEEGLLQKIQGSRCPAVLAINKIDTVEKDKLLEVINVYSQKADFDAVVPISAKTGDGVEDLLGGTPGDGGNHPGEAAVVPGPGSAPRNSGGDHQILRTGQWNHRHRRHHLLREGQPQGHHHRQGRGDAEKDFLHGPFRL